MYETHVLSEPEAAMPTREVKDIIKSVDQVVSQFTAATGLGMHAVHDLRNCKNDRVNVSILCVGDNVCPRVMQAQLRKVFPGSSTRVAPGKTGSFVATVMREGLDPPTVRFRSQSHSRSMSVMAGTPPPPPVRAKALTMKPLYVGLACVLLLLVFSVLFLLE